MPEEQLKAEMEQECDESEVKEVCVCASVCVCVCVQSATVHLVNETCSILYRYLWTSLWSHCSLVS